MSKPLSRADPKKVTHELFALTYGAIIAQLIKDYEDDIEVNKQLDMMGYNIGIRLIEDFLARSKSPRCSDLREVADVMARSAFDMFLGTVPEVGRWTDSGDQFSLIMRTNPLTDFVELPDEHRNLSYSSLISGAVRGALEMVQIDADVQIVADSLRGDPATEIQVKFIRRLEDAIPAGED